MVEEVRLWQLNRVLEVDQEPDVMPGPLHVGDLAAHIGRVPTGPHRQCQTFLPGGRMLAAVQGDGRNLPEDIDSTSIGLWVPCTAGGGPYAMRTIQELCEINMHENPEGYRHAMVAGGAIGLLKIVYVWELQQRASECDGPGAEDSIYDVCRKCAVPNWAHDLFAAVVNDGSSHCSILHAAEEPGRSWKSLQDGCKGCEATRVEMVSGWWAHAHFVRKKMSDFPTSLVPFLPLFRLGICGVHGLEYIGSWVVDCSIDLLRKKVAEHTIPASSLRKYVSWVEEVDTKFRRKEVSVVGKDNRVITKDHIFSGTDLKKLFCVALRKREMRKRRTKWNNMIGELPAIATTVNVYRAPANGGIPIRATRVRDDGVIVQATTVCTG